MKQDSRIFVAGHRGLVGSALCRRLAKHGYSNIITLSRNEADLTDPMAVKWLFSSYLPEYVFMSAAKVGGIVANSTYPVEFMTANMRMELNVLESAKEAKVKKLLFLGSACAYPKLAENPIREDSLLTGPLEPSNELYALAKISGIRLCEAYRREYGCDFISVMPTNLYGIGDHYDLENSHVIPGMIHRIHLAAKAGAKQVKLWGTGLVSRDFLFADDLAEACLLLMLNESDLGLVNVASGLPLQLRELAACVVTTVGFPGEILWDAGKPDGTPARAMDTSKVFSLGWRPTTWLPVGLSKAYQDFLCQQH